MSLPAGMECAFQSAIGVIKKETVQTTATKSNVVSDSDETSNESYCLASKMSLIRICTILYYQCRMFA